MKLLFITGNKHKLNEAQQILPTIVGADLDLPELQSLDPKEIIATKLETAKTHFPNDTIIVEDVSFWIGDIGFPGPLFKFLHQALGAAGTTQFAQAFNTNKAIVECMIGLLQPNQTPQFFSGTINGTIVPPQGHSNFGFDPIFIPENHSKTFAEMSMEEKNNISHRKLALEKVKKYLT